MGCIQKTAGEVEYLQQTLFGAALNRDDRGLPKLPNSSVACSLSLASTLLSAALPTSHLFPYFHGTFNKLRCTTPIPSICLTPLTILQH
jgi:hypothetical protein